MKSPGEPPISHEIKKCGINNIVNLCISNIYNIAVSIQGDGMIIMAKHHMQKIKDTGEQWANDRSLLLISTRQWTNDLSLLQISARQWTNDRSLLLILTLSGITVVNFLLLIELFIIVLFLEHVCLFS